MKYLIPCRMEVNDYGDVEFFRFFDTKEEKVVRVEPDKIDSLLGLILTVNKIEINSVDDLINYVLMSDFKDSDEFDTVAYCACRNEEYCFLLYFPDSESCKLISKDSYLICVYYNRNEKLSSLYDSMDFNACIGVNIDVCYPNMEHTFLKIYKACGTGIFIGKELVNVSGDTLILSDDLIYAKDVEDTGFRSIKRTADFKCVVFSKNTKVINLHIFNSRVFNRVETIMCSRNTKLVKGDRSIKVEYYD